MNNHTPHTKLRRVRPAWVVLCLAFAVSLALAASSAQARTAAHASVTKAAKSDAVSRAAAPAARRQWPTIYIISTSPATPVAGQAYTLTFAVKYLGQQIEFTDWGCLAMVGGRPIAPGPQVKSGLQASCTWNIPTTAKGKSVDGLIAGKTTISSVFMGWNALVS